MTQFVRDLLVAEPQGMDRDAIRDRLQHEKAFSERLARNPHLARTVLRDLVRTGELIDDGARLRLATRRTERSQAGR